MEFMADPSNAAAGSNAPEAARGSNPPEFGGQHDRNLWMLATLIYKQSYEKETGGFWALSPHTLWKETCEEPSGFRNPVPDWMWRRVRANDPSLRYSGVTVVAPCRAGSQGL